MKKILIFGSYPTEDNIKDGMLQRIRDIDTVLHECRRTYVSSSCLHNIKKQVTTKENGNLIIYNLNLFVHIFLIIRLIRSHNNIYCHSLYGFFKYTMLIGKGNNLILDFHGSVPEELNFRGQKLLSLLYGLSERRAIKCGNTFVSVSEEMREFYQEKYPCLREKNCIVKSICSQDVFYQAEEKELKLLKNEMGISDSDTVFIYSGNLQAWQNVDLTIQSMLSIARDNYFFIFLTLYPMQVERMIKARMGDKDVRYAIRSVLPKDLCYYYTMAHYGYILRDNHVLNRVAAPTKLIEYLYYGMTPIVKYERIGDSYRLGYEYVSYQDDLSNLKPYKSSKNMEVAETLMNRNRETSILPYLK